MKRFISLILISIFLQQTVIAQIPATFQIRSYSTENGLPSNGLKGLQWDEQTGFLWIATEAGIVRFNGIDFKTYTKQNTPFIASERMRFMIRNNRENILAVDMEGNIVKVRQNELVFHRSIASKGVWNNPSLYTLSVSDTLFNYKVDHPGTKSYAVFFSTLLPLTDTSMLVIDEGSAYLISLTNKNSLRLFENTIIKTGFKIGNNLFLVSDKNDFFLADISAQKLLPVPFSGLSAVKTGYKNENMHLFWDNGLKNPILINENKAWQLIYDGRGIVAWDICNVIPTNVLIRHVQYSEEKKLLFLGTDSKGLIVINQNRVDVVRKKQISGNEKNTYYSQIEMPGNNILTSEGHVIGQQENMKQRLPITGKFYFNVYLTSDSLLWFPQLCQTSYSCLHSYNYKTGNTTAYDKVIVGENFGLSYSNNQTYIATDNGLGILQDDSLHYLFTTAPGKKAGAAPYAMQEMAPGILGVATCNGVLRYNTIANTVDTLLSLPGYCVRTLWKYQDYLFIGTYGKGYYIYKNGKLKAMPLDKNNFLQYVHCFIPDNYDYCWISTNRGLFKFNLPEVIHAFETNVSKIYYHYFGRNDGMDITEMNGGCTPCALQMKSGTLSFPTMDGLLWIDPQKAMPILPDGDIFIDEMLVDNKKTGVDSLESKSLPSSTDEIMVRLGFSAWCNKENIYLEYQLNDTLNWKLINADEGAAIRLSNLSSGNYRLRIRKLNGFGPNNYSYKELRFSISTPWYRQWWFYTLVALFVIVIGRLYFKLRTRQYLIRQQKLEEQVFEKTRELQYKNEILEKNNTIKTRLISIISHDIVTPLKFLTVAGKNLLQKKELMSEELQEETIRAMTNTSQELQLLSTNILNWIKYQNENRLLAKETFNMHELVQQVLGILNSLAQQKNLRIVNEVDPEASIYQFYEPMKILVYNMLTNAIHFSEKGTITVNTRTEYKQTIVTVKDEGVGMSSEKIQSLMGDQVVISSANVDNKKGHGLGFLIIKDLLKTMGASLDIKSKLGEGSAISIIIPREAGNK